MINATGLQTNAIVVSIRSEQAEEFERLFADEELIRPIRSRGLWRRP